MLFLTLTPFDSNPFFGALLKRITFPIYTDKMHIKICLGFIQAKNSEKERKKKHTKEGEDPA